jgi:LmbE family N-acetylglucosaminyl deacetylase
MKSHYALNEASVGAPEEPWRSFLQAQPNWSPEGGPLIVVAAHPCQETLGAGGLIASYARRLRPVIVVSVTDGRSNGSGWQGQHALRRAELKQALELLSPHMILQTRLGLLEGEVMGHEGSLHALLRHLIRPGAVLVGPYKQDAHPDFDAVGNVCRQVALEYDLQLARYPVQSWQDLDFNTTRGANWARYELNDEARAAKTLALKVFKATARVRSEASPRSAPEAVISPYEAFLL